MNNQEPQRLGKYQLIEELGRGGFATVYRALDTTLKREVALKILDPLLFRDPVFVQRFQQEAVIAANLDHPNIVPVYEIDETEGRYYIAMKLVAGHSLAELIQTRGALPVEGMLSIIREVAAALDCIHKQGLIHRDVKPSNILLDDSGKAMLSDFGLVRATEGSRLSTQGVSIGTPSYMAPEQAEGQPVDARTDIYAMGIILYEMATGHLPFSADSPAATLYQHVHKPPPPPSSVNPDVTPTVEQVILRALEKDPDLRYQTAGALADDLTRAGAGRPLAPRPQPRPAQTVVPSVQPQHDSQPVQPEPRRHWSKLGAPVGCAAIFVCVVLAGGGFLAWQGGLLDALLPPAPTTSAEASESAAILPTPTTSPTLAPSPAFTPEPTWTPELAPTWTLEPTPTPVPPTPEPTATLEWTLTDVGVAEVNLTLFNDSGWDVCYVYISPTSSDAWGDDWLGADIVPDGTSYTFQVPIGSYDLLAEDCDENALAEEYGVSVSEDTDWTLSPIGGEAATLTVYNDTGTPIWYVYISPSTSDSWGDDWLGSVVIPANASYTFELTEGTYDLKAEDENYNVIGIRFDEYVSGDLEWTLYLEDYATLTLFNDSGCDVCYVYVSPSGSTTWGDDWLGGSEMIASGDSRTFQVSMGTYDLLAEDCDHDTLAEEYEVNLFKPLEWTLTP